MFGTSLITLTCKVISHVLFSAGTFFCPFSILLDRHASVAAAVAMVVAFLPHLHHSATGVCFFNSWHWQKEKKNQIKSKSVTPEGLAFTMHLKFSKVFLSTYFLLLKLLQLIIPTVISTFSIGS